MTKDYDPESAEAMACKSQPVGVHTLASSPTNPRKTFDPVQMAELVQSVKEHGILTPILVRCWPAHYAWTGDMPLWEVVAGERRYRAAKEAGLTLIPAMIRNLTNTEVLEIQVIENLQRADLHPLEEADGYGLMMKHHGYTAEQIAEKIGKSRSYIFGRLKLLALDDDSRRLFSGGVLNASTALLVARIPTATLRAKAIKEITETDYNGDSMSVREAQRLLQNRYMLRLATATFPINDQTLPGGSCDTCAKRTGNIRDLFEDVDSPDVCTDPDCFGQKRLAIRERDISRAKESGAEVIEGGAAKKIAPYGINDYGNPKDYTRLDSKCYDDAENRTYREILGDAVEVTLVEDAVHDRLVPLIKNTVLADKLKEAGIESSDAKADKAKKRIEAKVTIERTYRERLFKNVRTEIGNYTMDGVPTIPSEISAHLLMLVALQMFERLYGDTQTKISALWQAEGKNQTERNQNFVSTIPTLSAGDLWRLLVDMLTIAGTSVTDEWDLNNEPKKLLDMATLFNLDAAEVRKDVISEQKEQAKAEKPAKKPASTSKSAQKSAADTAAGAPSPSEAAQAGKSLRVNEADSLYADALAVVLKNRGVRISTIQRELGIGYNRTARLIDAMEEAGAVSAPDGKGVRTILKPATEAAQAQEESGANPFPADAGIIETNETPIETDAGAGTGEAAVIEKKETPTGTKPAVLYRHPTDTGVSWKGIGRTPNWVREWLADDANTLDMLKAVA